MASAQGRITVRRRPNDGAQGLQGCIQRLTEWASGVEYRNDSSLTTTSLRYIDVVVVTASDGTFNAYMCKTTHTSSSSNKPSGGKDSTYWTALNMMQPIYTPMIVADYANLRFTQTNQFLVEDDDSNIIAGMGGGNYPLWIGGVTPLSSSTKFKVSQSGVMECVNAILQGTILATGGKFGCLQIDGNDIIGLDSSGKAVVRLSVGSVPSVGDAYTTASMAFDMSSDEQDVVVGTVLENGYTRGLAERQVYVTTSQDGTKTIVNSLTCELTFTLSQSVTTISIGDISSQYTTASGTLKGAPITTEAVLKKYNTSTKAWETVTSATGYYGNRVSLDKESLEAGSYKVLVSSIIENIEQYMGSSTSWDGLLDVDIQSIMIKYKSSSTATSNQLVIAGDGILSMASSTQYFRWAASSGFECRMGSYGLRVTSSGVQKLSGGTWTTI